jgi:hypothetical protein
MANTSSIKRLQQFVNRITGQKVRVTKITKTELASRKHDVCEICNVKENGLADKTTARTVKADSIRRHYFKYQDVKAK